MLIKWGNSFFNLYIYFVIHVYFLSLKLIKEYCLGFIVKEENFYEIVMSSDFVNLDKPLMVEIIRKRLNPGKNIEIKYDKMGGKLMRRCKGFIAASIVLQEQL